MESRVRYCHTVIISISIVVNGLQAKAFGDFGDPKSEIAKWVWIVGVGESRA
ncbi:uncharacterized protein G2W53_016773 [Senna tora]|uniref:Uncharacterized protein n=1 Tax=Senna tora TaxID=362788 RepID=A0A834TQ53_9FABA|nr:uncharacterized protein G2W53_016773 [Senna tora]